MDNTYRPDEIARDYGETVLPGGVEHGTYRAGEPAFEFRSWDSKCPICGVLFRRDSNNKHGYCSNSCAAKGNWRRRKA